VNKVALEGVLAGRPVVTSRISNAVELLGDAVVEVPREDSEAYRQAIQKLSADPEFYAAKCRACHAAKERFYDSYRSWGGILRSMLAAREGAALPKETE